MNRIQFLSSTLDRWVEYLLFGLGISMALVVAAQVFARYVLNHSLFWSEELARYMLVWLTFLGASTAYRRGLHPGVDVLVKHWPARMQKLAAHLVHALSLGLFVVMLTYGVSFAHFIRAQISPALHLPMWAVVGIIPLCGLILVIHALAFLFPGYKEANRAG